MKCYKCGGENIDGARFCKECGTELPQQSPINYDGVNYAEVKPPKKKSPLNIILIILIIITVLAVGTVVTLFVLDNNSNSAPEVNTIQTYAIETIADSETEPTTEEVTEPEAETVKVPDVEGLISDDAAKLLERAGLNYTMRLEESDSVELDYVISQYPSADKWVEKGETVTLYISKSVKETEPESSVVYHYDDDDTLYCRASDFATLRDVPSRSGKSLKKIKTKESVEWISSSGDFYYVKYKDKYGYVLKEFFSEDYDAPLNYGTGNLE